MNDRGEGSLFGRLAYAAGYALGRADTLFDGDELLDAETYSAPHPYPGPPPNDHEAPPSSRRTGAWRPVQDDQGVEQTEVGPSAAIALGTLAAGWLLSRLIRPRPVNWPRAVLAGVAGTVLADLADSLGDPDPKHRWPLPPQLDDLPRYAAGIATAAAYGAQIYPRLPGSPLTRGLIFGMAEAMVAESGGVIGIVHRLAPQFRVPLGSLARFEGPQRGTMGSLAFGLGLGLYSARGKRR